MKGLFEAVLNLDVSNGTEKAYKKAFEEENERYLTKHTLRDGSGNVIKDELKSVWGGNYCHVDILYSLPGKKVN